MVTNSLSQINEGFESGLPASYTTTTSYTLSSGTWTGQASGVIGNTTATWIKSGTRSCQLRSQVGSQITTPTITQTVGTVTFWASRTSGSGSSLQVNYSTDGGTTWVAATGSPFSLNTTVSQYTATVNTTSVNVKLQFYRTAGTVNIDDVVINKNNNSVCSTVTTLSLPSTVGSTTTTGTQTTCGKVNDFPAGSFGSSLYGDGQDAVWQIDVPVSGGNYKFDIGGAGTYKILSLHSSCSPTSGNALNWITTSSGTTGNFSQNLTTGTYYLWVDTWPSPDCGQYSITITRLANPPAPSCISSPTSPTNGQTDVSTAPTLSWPTASNATSYDVYFGSTLPITPTINVTTTSYTPSSLSITTTYYWKIVPKNSSGEPTGCSTWSFTTLTPITNDDPSGSTTLIVNDPLGYKTFTNVGSSNTTTESSPTCASYNGEDVWFKVVVPNGITTLDFDTQTGGITDGGMSIYRGTIGSLTQIECDDDDALDGLMSWIYREDFTPGETIYIRFWEYGGGTGTFKIYVSTPQALPVELISFNATCSDEGILINWKTASEHNSSHFTLEKSRDGEDWSQIYTEQAAGNSNQIITYSFTDKNTINGINYYRLNQYDIDGVYEQYGPISANCLEKTKGYFSTFPNPSFSTFNITVNNESIIGESIIEIVDDIGRKITNKNVTVSPGINLFNLNIDIEPGIYYINIHNDYFSTDVIKQIIR